MYVVNLTLRCILNNWFFCGYNESRQLGSKDGPGIRELPDELLEIIFSLACSGKGLDNMSITGTCKQFRRIALCQGSLWSHISSKRSMEYVKMQLSRCKNSKLTIEYTTHFCQDLDARRCECFDFWTMVLKKHEKIHKVMLSYDVAHGDAQLFDLLGGLSFPLLRTLILTSNITTH